MAGSEFVSFLQFTEGALERVELCAQCSEGVAEDQVFAFWRGQVAADRRNRPRPLDVDFLIDFFKRLQGPTADERHAGVAYIVALLLVRKKILVISGESATEAGEDVLSVRFARDESETEYPVPVPELSEERMESIRDDLGRIFNLEGAPNDSSTEEAKS